MCQRIKTTAFLALCQDSTLGIVPGTLSPIDTNASSTTPHKSGSIPESDLCEYHPRLKGRSTQSDDTIKHLAVKRLTSNDIKRVTVSQFTSLAVHVLIYKFANLQ